MKKTDRGAPFVFICKPPSVPVFEKGQLKRISRRSILGALAVGVPSGVWASAIEPNLLSITRKDIKLPRWPAALDGFKVAHLTDLHYRPESDAKLIAKIKAALKQETPDLILLTGDFVIEDSSVLPTLFHELRDLEATHGIIASPGNHDRWHCYSSQLRKEIEAVGFSYLENAGTSISIKGESIFVNGLDSIWGGHPSTERAWKGHKNSPVISLVHEPDPFDELREARRIDLQLSGHTHGGQCRVPLIGYAPVKVKYGRKYIYGHFQNKDSHLWVGRGIGTVGTRVRFACTPEVAILSLRSS